MSKPAEWEDKARKIAESFGKLAVAPAQAAVKPMGDAASIYLDKSQVADPITKPMSQLTDMSWDKSTLKDNTIFENFAKLGPTVVGAGIVGLMGIFGRQTELATSPFTGVPSQYELNPGLMEEDSTNLMVGLVTEGAGRGSVGALRSMGPTSQGLLKASPGTVPAPQLRGKQTLSAFGRKDLGTHEPLRALFDRENQSRSYNVVEDLLTEFHKSDKDGAEMMMSHVDEDTIRTQLMDVLEDVQKGKGSDMVIPITKRLQEAETAFKKFMKKHDKMSIAEIVTEENLNKYEQLEGATKWLRFLRGKFEVPKVQPGDVIKGGDNSTLSAFGGGPGEKRPKAKYTTDVPIGTEKFWDDRLNHNQNKIVELAKNGATNEMIADEMMSTPGSVKVMISKIRKANPDIDIPQQERGRPTNENTQAYFDWLNENPDRFYHPTEEAKGMFGLNKNQIASTKKRWGDWKKHQNRLAGTENDPRLKLNAMGGDDGGDVIRPAFTNSLERKLDENAKRVYQLKDDMRKLDDMHALELRVQIKDKDPILADIIDDDHLMQELLTNYRYFLKRGQTPETLANMNPDTKPLLDYFGNHDSPVVNDFTWDAFTEYMKKELTTVANDNEPGFVPGNFDPTITSAFGAGRSETYTVTPKDLPYSNHLEGKAFKMFENPSKDTMEAMMKSGTSSRLRAVKDKDGNIFVWPSEKAIHADIRNHLKKLGIETSIQDVGYFTRDGNGGFEWVSGGLRE